MADTFGWNEALNKKFRQATPFNVVIAISTVIDPIKALIYTAVINGIVTVPIFYTILKICNDKTILETHTYGRISNMFGWSTFLIIGTSVVILFLTWSRS